MSILNQANDGNLSLLVAFWKALRTFKNLDRKDLLARCAPADAIDDKQGKAATTLRTWTKVGVFKESEGGALGLANEVNAIDPSDIDGFRLAVLKLVIASEAISAGDQGGPADDFLTITAWSLMQDPYKFDPDWKKCVEPLHRSQGPDLMNRDNPWNGFRVWGPFLGVALRGTKSGLVLNPACAVRKTLADLFKNELITDRDGVAIDDVLRRLALALPFIDRGGVWNSVAASLKSPWRRFDDTEISPCLSLALRQLEHEQRVRLMDRADAPVQYALLGRDGRQHRRVTHLIWEPVNV